MVSHWSVCTLRQIRPMRDDLPSGKRNYFASFYSAGTWLKSKRIKNGKSGYSIVRGFSQYWISGPPPLYIFVPLSQNSRKDIYLELIMEPPHCSTWNSNMTIQGRGSCWHWRHNGEVTCLSKKLFVQSHSVDLWTEDRVLLFDDNCNLTVSDVKIILVVSPIAHFIKPYRDSVHF